MNKQIFVTVAFLNDRTEPFFQSARYWTILKSFINCNYGHLVTKYVVMWISNDLSGYQAKFIFVISVNLFWNMLFSIKMIDLRDLWHYDL